MIKPFPELESPGSLQPRGLLLSYLLHDGFNPRQVLPFQLLSWAARSPCAAVPWSQALQNSPAAPKPKMTTRKGEAGSFCPCFVYRAVSG